MFWNVIFVLLGLFLAICAMAFYRILYPKPMRGVEPTILGGNKINLISSREIHQVPLKTPIFVYLPEDAVIFTAFGKQDSVVISFLYPEKNEGTEERRTIIVRKEGRKISIAGLNYLGHFISSENENLYVFEVVKELSKREIKKFA